MRRTAAQPGPNGLLGASNAAVNNQALQNAQLAQQSLSQRTVDAMSQRTAGMTRQMDEGLRQENSSEYEAQKLLNDTKSNILEAAGAPAALMLMSDNGMAEKVARDITTQKAINERINPDLGDYAGQLSA